MIFTANLANFAILDANSSFFASNFMKICRILAGVYILKNHRRSSRKHHRQSEKNRRRHQVVCLSSELLRSATSRSPWSALSGSQLPCGAGKIGPKIRTPIDIRNFNRKYHRNIKMTNLFEIFVYLFFRATGWKGKYEQTKQAWPQNRDWDYSKNYVSVFSCLTKRNWRGGSIDISELSKLAGI